MITLFTATPGGGKSAAVVDMLIDFAAEGRPIYCNGIPELKVSHIELDDPRQWQTEVPDGAVVVIDEVQRVWRPAASGAKVPPDIEALETHRHRGIDFLLSTQHPNLLHSNVRRLIGRHVHLRDVGLLGRWWYEWPECAEPSQFRNAPVKKRYRLPKRTFGLYKSASLHIKPIRSIPRSVIVAGAAIVLCAGLVYKGYASVSGKIEAAQAPKPPVMAQAGQGQAAAQPTAGPATVLPVAAASKPSEPERPKVTGCISAKDYCRCFDRDGFPMVVEWELCKTTAVGFNGLIPLQLKYDKPSAVAGAASQVLAAEVVAASHGFNAGDFRERPARRP